MERTHYSPRTRLGIVGGGQLARMLALAAHRMGLHVWILSEKEDDPGAQVVRHWIQGPLNDSKTLLDFATKVDLLTFESEFIDVADLDTLAHDVDIFPPPKALGLLRDRLTQKQLLKDFAIPTAAFCEVSSGEQMCATAQNWSQFVLKKRTGGYDGYGTFFVRKPRDLEKYSALFPDLFIAEELVPFTRELAVLFVRSKNGSFTRTPLVESIQKDRRCDFVIGPQTHRDLDKITLKFAKLMKSLNYVGVLAVEMFDRQNQLIVNELAPRVHNSGHYSDQALPWSQFDLHLLAGLGAKLGRVDSFHKYFAMANLIGGGLEDPLLPKNLSGKLHWYGKAQSRKGRKMGHINFTSSRPLDLLTLAKKERRGFRL